MCPCGWVETVATFPIVVNADTSCQGPCMKWARRVPALAPEASWDRGGSAAVTHAVTFPP